MTRLPPLGAPASFAPAVRFAGPTLRRLTTGAALALIILVPLSLLFDSNGRLGGDYDSSYWMTGYDAAYFKLYHHPTNVFQTSVSLGIAFPVFYGVLFYRLAGLIATLINPDSALRVVLIVAFAAQIATVYRAACVLRAGRGLGLFFALATACSTYALTNLYNRADLPEFVAVALLTTAIGAWFWSLGVRATLEIWLCRAAIATCLTLIGGTHLITWSIGGVTFFFVCALTLRLRRERSILTTTLVALAAYGIGAAIGLADFLTIGHQIRFSPGAYTYGFGMMSDRIDAPVARFAFFPLDPQSLYAGAIDVSTPYLEAPIDYAFLIFALGAAVMRRNVTVIVFGLAALAVGAISVWPWFWEIVPAPLHFFQFTYRLTSYANLLALCAAFTVLWQMPETARRLAVSPWPWIAGTVAVMALVVKLAHASVNVIAQLPQPTTDFSTIGAQFGAAHMNYTTIPRTGKPVPAHTDPPAIGMYQLGAPIPQPVVADRNGLVFTRILVFPWNAIIVDGKILPAHAKLAWRDWPYYGFRVAPRSRHLVQTTFILPPPVDRAIRLAEYALILELASTAALLAIVAIPWPFDWRRNAPREAG